MDLDADKIDFDGVSTVDLSAAAVLEALLDLSACVKFAYNTPLIATRAAVLPGSVAQSSSSTVEFQVSVSSFASRLVFEILLSKVRCSVNSGGRTY